MKIISIIMAIFLTCNFNITPFIADDIYPIPKSSYDYIETNDMDYLKILIADCENKLNETSQRLQAIRTQGGYSVNSLQVQQIKKEYSLIFEIKEKYIKHLDNLKYKTYPNAYIVWNFLKNQGYNDYICAGILGNIMAEVGGNTLEIKYSAETEDFYGMCQWAKIYYPDVLGKDLFEQCDFLMSDIKYQFDTFGFLYSDKFNYNNFLKLSNEQTAAYAFAKCYERCDSQYYEIRKTNASVAYNFFT